MTAAQILEFKEKAIQYASRFEVCCYLDSHHYQDKYGKHNCLIAFGKQHELCATTGQAFNSLKGFVDKHNDWLFGLLSYDLKGEIENLDGEKDDQLQFPDLYFFIPANLISISGTEIKVLKGSATIIEEISAASIIKKDHTPKIKLKRKFTKPAYIETVQHIQQQIKRGDIYEMNFCQEFFAENAIINPLAVYQQLAKLSPTPFSGFFKLNDKYVLSATPERFLTKRGNTLTSQPIKGTARRSANETEDIAIKLALQSNKKEQAENVMIVDLVRNDLTKSAVKGSVRVDELFGVYSFAQVHQMISSISCELAPEVHLVDAIKNTFPMGSMTGAPKLRAMQLIDQYEQSKRGIYSGSMGYITPDQDFDFNVIIRTILYNSTNKYLSFQVGSAITYQANAENEYEECILKASAIMSVLKN
ncbi:anthranilate synthase component I family protein [Nubsella zeaxanthinifaciens]|uniref:anthranilate synthase component I family protein n=1 Tax=Nubsella zeaxanthinifaciens TaxID=392412 RepID=UPI003D004C8D